MRGNMTAISPAVLARLCLLATIVAVALLLAAMFVYAGGSGVRPSTPGFDPVHNYFCDLIRPVAHNGVDNRTSMWMARAGMLLTAMALAPVWLLLPAMFDDHRAARWCRGPGLLAAAALPAVALTPSDAMPHLHTLTNAGAGLPGSIALCAGAVGMLAVRQQHRRLWRWTLGLLVTGLLTGALWVAAMIWTWPGRWALPSAQKLAWVVLVAWMVATALAAGSAARGERPASQPAPPSA